MNVANGDCRTRSHHLTERAPSRIALAVPLRAVCLRQRSLSFHPPLDAENHLVELLSWKVFRREGRERVHIDCLLSFERELYVLRLSQSRRSVWLAVGGARGSGTGCRVSFQNHHDARAGL